MIPHLSILRPSPTTISYTLSTRSPTTWHHTLTFLLRCILFFATILVCLLRAAATREYVVVVVVPPECAVVGAVVDWITALSWMVVGLVVGVGFFVVFRRFHTEESLLTICSLGIQTQTLSPSYLLPASTRFIPTAQIRDIFIHEAFRGFEVRHYLAIVVEGEWNVVVVFPKLLPPLSIVEEVWRGARKCLYESSISPSPMMMHNGVN